MRKLALVIGSLAAVVVLALLVHVADNDDGVTYRGSSEQLKHRPHGGHLRGQVRGDLRGHRPCGGPGLMGDRRAGHKPDHTAGGMPGRGCRERPELRPVGCHRGDGGITLTFSYGAGERVAPFMEPRGRGIVVGVEIQGPPRGTIQPTIGMLGSASFATFGDPTWIRDPEGKDVRCPRGEGLVRRAP